MILSRKQVEVWKNSTIPIDGYGPLIRNLLDTIDDLMADRPAPSGELDEYGVNVIKNLSMLVRRLAYRHPNQKLREQAFRYLDGEGLQGDILRGEAKADASAAQAGEDYLKDLAADLTDEKYAAEYLAACAKDSPEALSVGICDVFAAIRADERNRARREAPEEPDFD